MASQSRKRMKLSELIGERPSDKRKKEAAAKQKQAIDRENLRKIATDKGLDPNF